MSRYRRINIDGKSLFKTETRKVGEDATNGLLPGTFAIINSDDEWEVAPAGTMGRVYVIEVGYHQGLSIRDAIPAGDSAVGNYVEEAREIAVLCPAGSYRKDQAIAVGSNGQGVSAGANVIGFSQDDAELLEPDYIRVRLRSVPSLPAVTSIDVSPATLTLEVDSTAQLTASAAPANANQGVNWTSSAPAVATVSPSGLVTGVSAGNATITATSSSDATKTDTCAVTVE